MSFEQLLQGHSPTVRELAEEARQLVLSVHPQAHQEVETSWGGYLLFKQVEGAGNTVCWISLAKKHVSIGFSLGAELADPDGLLEGTGKRQRHVKVKQASQLSSPGLRALLERAWASQPQAEVLQDALARVREICLGLEGTREKLSHGHPTFYTGKRSYATYGIYAPSIAIKPDPVRALAYAADERFFPTPYLAHQGWLSLRIDAHTDWGLVRQLLEESYGQA
ncbi:DUF1801 domain-containing protein [bacterium]|nr:DUF1801 domain-containing protein [bacterium]